MDAAGNSTQVLIVGAGPTGLMLACDLARRGVRIRVVDKALEYFTGSRGKGVSPRTLEVFDDLGVAERILSAGLRDLRMRTYEGDRVIGETIANPALASTPAIPYPAAVFIPQLRTEAILRDELARRGVTVELDHEVIAVDHRDDAVVVTLAGGDATTEVHADYVVGCDGGHSTVRRLIGLSFDVTPSESAKYSWVGDVRVDGLSPTVVHRWNDRRRGLLLLSPFKDTDLWQFQFLPTDGQPPLPEPDLHGFRQIWHDWTGRPEAALLEARTASRFRINEHIADHYRAGRVFLAGDAAHVYSPAGGQGMTTGVQDACNLGWKLAAVLAGAPERLLETYESERRPVAEHAMKRSRQRWREVNEAVVAKDDSELWHLVINQHTSQLDISYRGGPLAPAGDVGTARLRPGDRAPDGLCRDDSGDIVRLFDLFRGTHWTALYFDGNSQAALPTHFWGSPVDGHCVGGDGLSDDSGAIRDSYGIAADTVVVVRPDGYIARIARPEDLADRPALLDV